MYKCPECGTEYTVVPDACTVCGHETDTSEHIDLFARAAEQERKIAGQQRELRQQYQDRAQAHKHAQDSAKSRSAVAAEERLTVLEQATAAAPDAAEQVRAASEGDAKSGKSRTGLKLAAVGAAAAVALGGGAFWAFGGGKPAGFVRSTVGTFYLKDQSLWFQNGQTGKKTCVNAEIFPLPSTRMLFTQYDNLPRLNDMLYVTPDGNDFYFPKVATMGVTDCVLMHCTADHPEQAEEVARINLRASDYNLNLVYSSFSSAYYGSGMTGLAANSYMYKNGTYYQMNLPYVICDGAVYYRNADNAFCCTQNGETQVIAPFVERFWTMPDQPGVYYIGVPDYENYQEKLETKGSYFHADYECMSGYVDVTVSADSETVETRFHRDDYILCRITPGNPAELLVPERIDDWAPIRNDFMQYFYYTTFNEDEHMSSLRRYDFLSGTAETVYSTGQDQKAVLLQDYPDGSCYIGEYDAPTQEDLENWMPDEEMLKWMRENSGEASPYIFMAPLRGLNIYYQENGGAPQALPQHNDNVSYSIYSDNLQTNACKPYLCMSDYSTFRKMHVYYRAQEVPVTYGNDTGVYTSPDYLCVSADGTRLIAESLNMAANSSGDYGYPDYGAPEIKVCCGTLNGDAEVEMSLVADYDDGSTIVTLEQEDAPAEVIRITNGDMYSGDEKIASGVLSNVFGQQPECRQICFVTSADYDPAKDSAYIDMNTAYCGTLMRRTDRKTETVAENVTDFVPVDKEQFMVICGEKGKNGALHYCAGEKWYEADTEVSNLIGVRTLAEKSLLDRLLR